MLEQLTITGATAPPPTPKAGSCIRCGRALKNPASVEAGMGPVCRGRGPAPEGADEDPHGDVYASGILPSPTEADAIICFRTGQGVLHFNIPRKHVHHSPTGWGWGYHGSGPADLALNILAYALGVAPTGWTSGDAEVYGPAPVTLHDGTRVRGDVWSLHQECKQEFVARLPEQGGSIPLPLLRAWFDHKRAAQGLTLDGEDPPTYGRP